jgi:putative transposase
MCKVFGHSKQAYYKQLQQNTTTTVKEEIIVGLIRKKREIWKRGSGRNLHQSLQKQLQTHAIKIVGTQYQIKKPHKKVRV